MDHNSNNNFKSGRNLLARMLLLAIYWCYLFALILKRNSLFLCVYVEWFYNLQNPLQRMRAGSIILIVDHVVKRLCSLFIWSHRSHRTVLPRPIRMSGSLPVVWVAAPLFKRLDSLLLMGERHHHHSRRASEAWQSLSVWMSTHERKSLFSLRSSEPLKNQRVGLIFSLPVCDKHFTDDRFLNLGSTQSRTRPDPDPEMKSGSVPSSPLGSATNLGTSKSTNISLCCFSVRGYLVNLLTC